jgi:Protein of unknown function (DUF4242)
MPVYLVDRNLPGYTPEQITAAHEAAHETSLRFAAQGHDVRYLRSTWVPGDARCMCLFEASDPRFVKEVNEAAHLTYSRIVEAFDLTPDERLAGGGLS